MNAAGFLRAAAGRLDELWPGRAIHVDDIPANADGRFTVRCVSQSHEKRLSRRRSRTYQLEILYFRKKRDSIAYCDWAETMYSGFEELEVDGRTFHLTGAHAEDTGDMVWHFVFDVSFTALIPPPDWERMEALKQTVEVKQDEKEKGRRAPL